MGLAYADTTAQRLATSTTAHSEDAWMERRTFLGLVSKIVMGATLTTAELNLIAAAPRETPVPHRVGDAEVTQLRAFTRALRTHDAAHGAGSCRDAILAHTQWAESLLTAEYSNRIRPDLLSAVAEAKTLAGWTAHDLGLAKEARQYLTQALQDTQQAGQPAHSAIVLYYLGRVPLDNGDPLEALKLFQLGQIAAQDSRAATPVAFLLANEAVAYAHLGDARQAMTALRRAEDEYTHTDQDDEHPEFTRMFDQVALNTAAARVHSQLGLTDTHHRDQAITRLSQTLTQDSAGRGRQRAFNQAWLATCHLADGDPSTGTAIGMQALDAARGLTSPRLLEQLAPLHAQTSRYPHDDAHQLAHELRVLRAG
jgi:tetratricopeptide (TPR) repeat protein